MATHEQTYLGAIINDLANDGWLTLADDVNSYGLVTEITERASELGVVIDAEGACADCLSTDPSADPAKLAQMRARDAELFHWVHAIPLTDPPHGD